MVVLPHTLTAGSMAATSTQAPAPTGMMALLLITQGKYAGFNAFPEGYIPPNLRGDPNYVKEERGTDLFIVLLVMTTLMLVMVIGRLWARWKLTGWFGSDDWWIIPATIFGVGHSIDLCFATQYGLGKHSWELTYEEVKKSVAINYPNLMLYAACMCCVKLSLLCFIRRLAGPAASRRMVWTIWLMGVFFVCHALGSIIVIVLWCLPVRANWDFDYRYLPNNPHVMCHDLHIWYWVSSGMHVVSDVAVLFLPIKMAWNLRMSRSKKIGVIIMFSLGSIACVCSMIRMGYIAPYVTSVDITWDSWPVALFGHLETSLAIMTASVPAMRPLLKRYLPGWITVFVTTYKSYASKEGTSDSRKYTDSYIIKHPAKMAAKQAEALAGPRKPYHELSFGSILNTTRRGSESDHDSYIVDPATSFYRSSCTDASKFVHHQDYVDQRIIRDAEWGQNITVLSAPVPAKCNDDRRPPVPPKDF